MDEISRACETGDEGINGAVDNEDMDRELTLVESIRTKEDMVDDGGRGRESTTASAEAILGISKEGITGGASIPYSIARTGRGWRGRMERTSEEAYRRRRTTEPPNFKSQLMLGFSPFWS